MKVAFIAHDGLSTVNFCRWFAAHFASRDDVTFYTISSRDLYDREIAALGSRHIDVTTDRFVHPLHDLRYLLTLVRVIRRERFDLVVTFGTKPNIYGPFAARVAGVPLTVLAVRGLGRLFGTPEGLRGRVLRWLMHRLYGAACSSVDRVWFTNTHDRDYFVASGLVSPDKTFLTANSVDTGYFSMTQVNSERLAALRRELAIADGDPVVIMVARLIWMKGVGEFLQAARLLRSRQPRLRFLLVAPEETSAINAVPLEAVREAQRHASVIWLGFRKDVRELYALSDVAVLPSYYKEGGFPRALLEPMSLGKPVIAADTDECRGPVEHGGNGFLVPPRDAEALADRIEELIADPELRRRMGNRSIEIVRSRFTDAIVGSQVLAEVGLSA